jgi:DNA repair protein RadC
MKEKRRQKLKSIVYAMRELNNFSTDDAKLVCHDSAPSYVTRTINQLVKNGFLDQYRVEGNRKQTLRWIDQQLDKLDQWIAKQIHGEQVKETPEADRPREILLRTGSDKLTLENLLAILIRTGVPGESCVQAARLLSNRFASRLHELPEAGMCELKEISRAIRKDSYCQIMAGIELGRRIALVKEQLSEEQIRIKGSDDAIRYCMKLFHRLAFDGKQEQFHVVTLDTQHGPINHHLITVGTLDASLVHPREVFRPAIRDAASAILLVHNHPSGDPTPSKEDRAVTRKLKEVGELVGIRVLDHIIVARESGRSLMADG